MKEKKSFLKLMQRIPGGLIIVPMLIGVLCNTFIPDVLELGGFTSGMFKTGTNCLLGMFLLLNGASINVKKIGLPLYKGFVLTLMKFVLGVALGLLVAIPSVVGYNIITSLIKATIVQMDNFVEEFIVKLKIEQLSTSR